jgi:hypothetical protein
MKRTLNRASIDKKRPSKKPQSILETDKAKRKTLLGKAFLAFFTIVFNMEHQITSKSVPKEPSKALCVLAHLPKTLPFAKPISSTLFAWILPKKTYLDT